MDREQLPAIQRTSEARLPQWTVLLLVAAVANLVIPLPSAWTQDYPMGWRNDQRPTPPLVTSRTNLPVQRLPTIDDHLFGNLLSQPRDATDNEPHDLAEPLETYLAAQQAEIDALRQQLADLQASQVNQNQHASTRFTLDSPADELSSLLARLAAVEQQVAASMDTSPKEPTNKTSKADEISGKPEGAVTSASSDASVAVEWSDVSAEKWTVKLGGHVQADYVNWANADANIAGTQDYFEFRRLRLLADGTGYGVYDFRLQMTLEPETINESPPGTATSPDVKDAYFSINELPWLGRLRVGNFFVPFSLEQVTNDTNNIFMERSIPTQGVFAADREVGLAFYNATADQNITWAFGAFFDSVSDTIKERIDDNQGYRLSGRLTWLPYFDEPSNGRYLWHVGTGILHTDDQDDRVRFRARPQIHEGPRLIDSDVLLADNYTTGNIESAIVWGRFTVQSEAFLSQINLLSGDSAEASGAYVHGSYFLTGENRVFERFGQHGAQFARNSPYSNFFAVPGFISWGAWEAKARWSLLNLNDLNRGQYNDLTVGFNWYWSDRVRMMFDWIHPVTSDNALLGATESDILAMRFDFNW